MPVLTMTVFSVSFLALLWFSSTDVLVDAFIPLSSSTASKSTHLFYDIQRDSSQPSDNVWSVLSNTERWISNTLADAQTGANNPLSRKEVSYVCETSRDPAMILANIFRKVKEAREMGESHAQDQEALIDEHGGTLLQVWCCCGVVFELVYFHVILVICLQSGLPVNTIFAVCGLSAAL